MQYKAPHWMAAATLIACTVWFFQIGSTPAYAFKEVVAHVIKARTARYDMVTKVHGQPEITMKAYYMEPSHFRQELFGGYVNIADWQSGKMVGLDTINKRATVFNLVNMSPEKKAALQKTGNQFEMLRDSLNEAIANPNVHVESLGEKTFDGRKAIGFRLPGQTLPMTVWADPRTKFPVRIEAASIGPPKTDVVMTNYEFDIQLNESLFRTDIPKGYTITEVDMDSSAPSEEDFIRSLRMVSEADNGILPNNITQLAFTASIVKYMQHLGAKDGKPTGDQLKKIGDAARGFQFAMALPAEANAAYAGGAKLTDNDRPVFWYKPVGTTTYRVIYADLSVKDAAEAPEVEGAINLRN